MPFLIISFVLVSQHRSFLTSWIRSESILAGDDQPQTKQANDLAGGQLTFSQLPFFGRYSFVT